MKFTFDNILIIKMLAFFVTWIIISNICHIIRRQMMNIDIEFRDTFIPWNIISTALLFWICMYRPTPQTLGWLFSFIR